MHQTRDVCDLVKLMRAYFFAKDRDVTLVVNRKVILGGGEVLDDVVNAPLVTTAASGALANERVLTGGTAASVTDGGAGGNVTIDHTQVAAGDLHTEYIQKSALTAKGDVISATAASTPAALNVGGDGRSLVADSAQATGLNWSTSSLDAVAAAQFITMAASGDLANERVLTAGTAISVTDGGAGGNATVDHTQVGAGDLHTEYVQKATLTAKGDVIGATAASTPAALGVGNDGDVLTADSAQATGLAWANVGVPSGVICMWSGAVGDIPANWQICDGTNGTPDLTDRFIVGAGDSYDPGDTGGSDSVNLQHNHSGFVGYESSHTHADGTYATDNEAAHHHSADGTLTAAQAAVGDRISADANLDGIMIITTNYDHTHDVTGDTSDAGSHAHDVTGTSASGSSHRHAIGNSLAATENRPAFYALCFIMKD